MFFFMNKKKKKKKKKKKFRFLKFCEELIRLYGKSSSIPNFTHWIILYPKFENFGKKFILHVEKNFFINFSSNVLEKSLNITNDKEKDFEDNVNFYVLCFFLGGNTGI